MQTGRKSRRTDMPVTSIAVIEEMLDSRMRGNDKGGIDFPSFFRIINPRVISSVGRASDF